MLDLQSVEEGLLLSTLLHLQGMSGRLLRKLPFLAHIKFVNLSRAVQAGSSKTDNFLMCMATAALKERDTRELSPSSLT